MSKLFRNICLVAGALSLGACNKNFLNRLPQSSLTEQNFFSDESDLETYTNGFYAGNFGTATPYPGWTVAINDQQSDNMEINPFNQVVAGKFTVPTAAGSTEGLLTGWNWYFLEDVNYFLQNYQKANASDAAKNHYAGVARFFRAWFYEDMVKTFGDVPWYGNTLTPTDSADLYKARDPRALVVDSIIADLRFAAANIYPTGPSGTITQPAALALLAQTALHEGTYMEYRGTQGWQTLLQLADSAAKAIMASGTFKLYSTGSPTQDYYKLFNILTPTDPMNEEVILAQYYSATLTDTHPLDAELNAGYGFSLTKDLMNTYLMADGTPFTNQAGYDTMEFATEFRNRDPRMAQTAIGPDYIRQGKPYAPLLGPAPTGYEQIKYYVDDPSQTGYNTSYNAAIIFRYGEILLIDAEARAELGTLTQGDLDATVNLLRTRVGMPPLNISVALDPVLATEYPNVTGPLKNVILEIRRERRVELACEGHRYDDLMRWRAGSLLANPFLGMYFPGLGEYDLNGDGQIDYALVTSLPSNPVSGVSYKVVGTDVYLTNGNSGNVIPYPTLVKTFSDPKNYLFPIPTTELQLNSKLVQNPGW